MKRLLLTLLICLITTFSFAGSIFYEGFEFANHDDEPPLGWTCDDNSWLCGYLDKDHNRTAHTGDWYAYTNANESWMFMPMYLSTELKYRFSYWAISDGSYEVEFWAGSEDNAANMSQLLFSTTVEGGAYELISAYIETINANYQYFGIHAVASEGAYHLTIDDINLDMVNKYDLEVTPYEFDTILYPGSQITIKYDVQNTGYEDLQIFMTPYTDYFTDIQFTEDGFNGSSFPTVSNQVVQCTCTATLLPSVAPGTRCWMDIMFTVSCDCVTRMATLWVTVADPTEVAENKPEIKLYPNPSQGHVNIEGIGQVTVVDLLGQTITTQWIDGKASIALPKGVYIIRLENGNEVSVRKLVIE
ncbi:MAG: T9SS type A sorting domain-containing protein [Bacteroidales bacterium]|nr:T9SS type A sorting domain-containing protein [Bacteroidales bacterium]